LLSLIELPEFLYEIVDTAAIIAYKKQAKRPILKVKTFLAKNLTIDAEQATTRL